MHRKTARNDTKRLGILTAVEEILRVSLNNTCRCASYAVTGIQCHFL